MEKTDRLIAMQMTGETTVIEFRQSPPSIKFVEGLVGGSVSVDSVNLRQLDLAHTVIWSEWYQVVSNAEGREAGLPLNLEVIGTLCMEVYGDAVVLMRNAMWD